MPEGGPGDTPGNDTRNRHSKVLAAGAPDGTPGNDTRNRAAAEAAEPDDTTDTDNWSHSRNQVAAGAAEPGDTPIVRKDRQDPEAAQRPMPHKNRTRQTPTEPNVS